MDSELQELLGIIARAAIFGLVIGLLFRKIKPDGCIAYAKFCVERKWWIYLFGFLMFMGFAIGSLFQNRPYFAGCLFFFAILQAFGFFRFGGLGVFSDQQNREK